MLTTCKNELTASYWFSHLWKCDRPLLPTYHALGHLGFHVTTFLMITLAVLPTRHLALATPAQSVATATLTSTLNRQEHRDTQRPLMFCLLHKHEYVK